MSPTARRTLPALALLAFGACNPATPPGGATPGGSDSRAAAEALLAALPDSLRAAASLPFDHARRSEWYFIPTEMIEGGRTGLSLRRIDGAEQAAAMRLLGSGLSDSGYRTARAIIENEAALGAMEDAAGTRRWMRDPELYFVTVFGTPSAGEPWGWRFEGHHLSVNATATGAGDVRVAPLFMGANPHRVPSGPRAGARLLAAEEDVARELMAMLAPDQRARAIVSDTTYGEMRTRNDPVARTLPTEGLAASEMTPAQAAKLRQLLMVYADRFPPAERERQIGRIEAAGFGTLRFVWAGSTELGGAHYYRIHGPTVLIEYDNSQNNANHSHTVWRDLQNDFGGDELREHYRRHRH